jgi:hypothetical protein
MSLRDSFNRRLSGPHSWSVHCREPNPGFLPQGLHTVYYFAVSIHVGYLAVIFVKVTVTSPVIGVIWYLCSGVSAYVACLSLWILLDSWGNVFSREWWRMNVCVVLTVTMDSHEWHWPMEHSVLSGRWLSSDYEHVILLWSVGWRILDIVLFGWLRSNEFKPGIFLLFIPLPRSVRNVQRGRKIRQNYP